MKELLVSSIYVLAGTKNWLPYSKLICFILPLKDGVRTFDDFIREGLIEYLYVNEENNSLVGSHPTISKVLSCYRSCT